MEEKLKLEKEKLGLEITKLKRDIDSNFEETRIHTDKEKHEKDHPSSDKL